MMISVIQGSPCAYSKSQCRPSISGSQVRYDDLHIDLHYDEKIYDSQGVSDYPLGVSVIL